MNVSLPDQLYREKWLFTLSSSPISAWLFAIVMYDIIVPVPDLLLSRPSPHEKIAAPWYPLISNRPGINAIAQRFRSIP